MKKIFLIDSMAYIFRSFYAIRPMNSSDGTPTNALLGFVKSIEKIITDFKPEQLVAVFDAGQKTFRNDIYPEYKANRSECPAELRPQFDLIKEYLRLRGIPIVIKERFEADDLIGTLAREAQKADMFTYICTGDKDMMQLVNEQTVICQTHKENLIVDYKKVIELIGVTPLQVIDYLAIMGDSSDNIPGLPGIGKKGAAELLQEFNDLETVLQSAEKVKGKRKVEALTNHQHLAILSKRLVTIDCQVKLNTTVDQLILSSPDWNGLQEFYQKYDMNQLIKNLTTQKKQVDNPVLSLPSLLKDKNNEFIVEFTTICPIAFQNGIISLKVKCQDYEINLLDNLQNKDLKKILKANRDLLKDHQCQFISNNLQLSSKKLSSFTSFNYDFLLACWLFDSELIYQFIGKHYSHLELICSQFVEEADFNEILKESVVDIRDSSPSYHIVETEAQLQHLFTRVIKAEEVCLDTETTSLKPFEAQLIGIGIGFKENEAYYVPFNGQLSMGYLVKEFSVLLSNPQVRIFGQNIKYDYEVLANNNIKIANISFDTLIASYLINPSSNFHNLDHQVLHYFNYRKIATKDLLGKGKKTFCMSELPIAEVATYCCEDVDFTWRLKKIHSKELINKKLDKLFYELEIPLIKIIAAMEKNGIAIDEKKLVQMSKEFSDKITIIEQKIYKLAETKFNIASPKQLGEVLFETLQLPHGKKTQSGYSTDASTLEVLKTAHPIIEKIIEFRVLSKLKSTYIDALPQEINPYTKRIHTKFSQATAATGRLASSHPNLQNIPTRSKEGKIIRSTFIAKPNHYFLSCDYSQIELRIMALLSKDKNLIEAFQQNLDIHTFTASLIFDTPLKQVTKKQRYNAKAVNFGVIYGQSSFGLASNLGISVEDAKQFIKNYFMRYPKVQSFMNEAVSFAQDNSYSETLFHRRRYIPEIYHSNGNLRKFGERVAINSPIQGSAADMIKIAMLDVAKMLKDNKLKSKMLLQIHDELFFEVPADELEFMRQNIPLLMENCYKAIIPFKVDVAIGKNWSECD